VIFSQFFNAHPPANENYGVKSQKHNRLKSEEITTKTSLFNPYFYAGVLSLLTPVFFSAAKPILRLLVKLKRRYAILYFNPFLVIFFDLLTPHHPFA